MKKNRISKLLLVIVLCLPVVLSAQNGTLKISFDDVIKNYSFFPESVYGIRSMNDGVHYTKLVEGPAIVKYSYQTGKALDTLFKQRDLKGTEIPVIENYTFSNDESRILLTTVTEQIFRYSSKSDYYVYTLKTQELKRLSDKGKQQLAAFSPDASMVSFVRDNNIFLVNLRSGEEKQITKDGKYNFIINGATDWVYEEEFGFSKAYEWSPDGSMLAFMRFDESEVPMFNMTMFEGQNPDLKENVLYPENRAFRYPKAGEQNSLVTVLIYNVRTGSDITVDVGSEKDQYIPRIKWTCDPAILCIYRLNRLQNKLEFLAADANSGQSKVFYSEENKYYIGEQNFDGLTFLKDNTHFIWLSEKDGWNHIYLCNMKDNTMKLITSGEYDVKQFYGIDEEKRMVYYQASVTSPLRTEVYSISLDGISRKMLSMSEGSNSAEFSKTYQYYILTFNNLSTPDVISLYDAKGRLVRVLEDNNKLIEKLKEYKFNYPEFFTFKNKDGFVLNGVMIKPPDFDPGKKYPVFMYQYSGPGSQVVDDRWGFGWNHYLAQEGYIIVSIDGRGTGGRGEEFRKMTYLQMGKFETIDQVEAARYLGALPYVDASRIGIWGWSFGGYMTLMCLSKGEGTFKMGIAVAPVTSWRYYDNIYTERYMRKPVENPEGYEENAPVNFADKFRGKLLIIHGTGDDNVHVQNTLEFTERLVQADKDFSMLLYTNRNHGIYGGNTSYHLFRNITNYILQNL